MASPWGRMLVQVGFTVLIKRLRTIAHPAAQIAARILIAVAAMDKMPDARKWALKELPKLDRELRKLQKTQPEFEYARIVVRKVLEFIKTTA